MALLSPSWFSCIAKLATFTNFLAMSGNSEQMTYFMTSLILPSFFPALAELASNPPFVFQILNSYKIAWDSRYFETKSRFGKSGGGGCLGGIILFDQKLYR